MDALRPETIAAWTRLMTVARTLLEGVEADLQAADLPPITWYDVLLELEKAGPPGLRPFALQDRLLLPQYSTSRLLARMEKANVVERAQSPEDARGHLVTLTAAGAALRRRMWPVYAASLRRRFESRLSAADAGALASLLDRFGDAPPVAE